MGFGSSLVILYIKKKWCLKLKKFRTSYNTNVKNDCSILKIAGWLYVGSCVFVKTSIKSLFTYKRKNVSLYRYFTKESVSMILCLVFKSTFSVISREFKWPRCLIICAMNLNHVYYYPQLCMKNLSYDWLLQKRFVLIVHQLCLWSCNGARSNSKVIASQKMGPPQKKKKRKSIVINIFVCFVDKSLSMLFSGQLDMHQFSFC